MEANVTPRHEPVRLPAAFVRWWLSDTLPDNARTNAHTDDAPTGRTPVTVGAGSSPEPASPDAG